MQVNAKNNFNNICSNAIDKGVVSDELGDQLLILVNTIVNISGMRDKSKDVRDIVKSDVCLECLLVVNKLIKSGRELTNPYGYFSNIINRVIGRIIKQRFSSNPTKDEFGLSLVSCTGQGSYNAKFVDVYDYRDMI